jgi:hypothetical protein
MWWDHGLGGGVREGVKAYGDQYFVKRKKNQHGGPLTHRNGIQNLDVNWKQFPDLKKNLDDHVRKLGVMYDVSKFPEDNSLS